MQNVDFPQVFLTSNFRPWTYWNCWRCVTTCSVSFRLANGNSNRGHAREASCGVPSPNPSTSPLPACLPYPAPPPHSLCPPEPGREAAIGGAVEECFTSDEPNSGRSAHPFLWGPCFRQAQPDYTECSRLVGKFQQLPNCPGDTSIGGANSFPAVRRSCNYKISHPHHTNHLTSVWQSFHYYKHPSINWGNNNL